MVQMAKPWKHENGGYYIYRQIPEPLRPAFAGKQFWKKSLRTRDAEEAKQRFQKENAALEERFAAARSGIASAALTNVISKTDARLLVSAALRSSGSKPYQALRRVWWAEECVLITFGYGGPLHVPDDAEIRELSTSAATDIRLPGDAWLEASRREQASDLASAAEIVIDGLLRDSRRPCIRSAATDEAILEAYTESVAAENDALRAEVASPGRRPTNRRRPDMTLLQLLDAWAVGKLPRKQALSEATDYVADLVAFVGPIPAAALTKDQLCDYRDAAASLPAAMNKRDRALPFPQRVARLAGTEGARVDAATVKKRLGLIQAMLSYADAMRWIEANVGANIPIIGYKRTKSERRSFRDSELQALFESRLFTDPASWTTRRSVSDATLFWLFLFGLCCGVRIEEIGKATVASIKTERGVMFIDIDGLVKTETSRRVIPVHDLIIEHGFGKYLQAMKDAGELQLFPDLKPNRFDKMTKEASRLANRYIDAHVSTDISLVYHSLRHKWRDLAANAKIPDSIADKISGHAPATIGRRYGDGAEVPILHEYLMRIKLSMIDWPGSLETFAKVDWAHVISVARKE